MLRVSTGSGVKVHQSFNLATDTVVEAANSVHVNEAVTNPFSRSDRVADFINEIKTSIDAVFGRDLTHGNCLRSDFSVERENIGGTFTCNQNHASTVRPVNLFGDDINFSYKSPTVPVIEQNRSIAGLDTDHVSSEKTFRRSSGRNHSLRFFEILENFDSVNSFANGVISSTRSGPNKVKCLSKSLVTQSLSSVDDKFTVSANGDKAPVAVVLKHLRKKLTGSQIAGDDRQTFSVWKCVFACTNQTTNSGGFDLVVVCPHNLSRRIHGGDRIV
mmetsp:Transcript_13600/g.30888  ORF Transcript_13600/g.30888 Transcript_13600/m.30888 type:complete len:273 (-) Transcript_13600:1003-1821(-)